MTNDGSEHGGMPFDLGMIMNKAQELQKKLVEQQAEAEKITAVGKAGGGMVVATANGAGKILRIEIEDALAKTGDKEMIEDLTTAAVNLALTQASAEAKAALGKLTGGMPMPFDINSILG